MVLSHPLFHQSPFTLIVKGLYSLPGVCPTTAQCHGCLSYLHPPNLSSFPISLLFFFHDRSTEFL